MNTAINQRLDWDWNAELSTLPMVGADVQRAGMRHFASGVSIITARTAHGPVGLTATAVCSVTVEPPRMVVLVNKKVAASEAILESGALCINVLAEDQEHMARVFAGMVEGVFGPARFEHGQWSERVTGSPVLDGALANFDCRVVKVYDESTHNAFLCEVLASEAPAAGEPLLYMNGAFRRVAAQE